MFNLTAEEEKILDQPSSLRKITHRNLKLHTSLSNEFQPSFLCLIKRILLYSVCSFRRRSNSEATDINKNIHGISVTQSNIVRRNSQENNINYNPYFVSENDFHLLRSYYFSDVGYEGKTQDLVTIVKLYT